MEHKEKITKQKKAEAKKKQAFSSIIEGVFYWSILAAVAYGAIKYFELL